jgi:hypothetical protein
LAIPPRPEHLEKVKTTPFPAAALDRLAARRRDVKSKALPISTRRASA